MNPLMTHLLLLLIAGTVSVLLGGSRPAVAAERDRVDALYGQQNLVAWCIVPFDAAKRGPVERAEMLKRLGITKLAYDWRAEHVPTFDDEIQALRKEGIVFFAFWDLHEAMFDLFEKYSMTPEIWCMLPAPPEGTRSDRVAFAGKHLLPLVERTRTMGCKLGIYNHGGWQGEPENMAAVCQWLRANADAAHVGIVYNFHHGHEHMEDFEKRFRVMLPYLLCVNVNGMVEGGDPKILPLGQGTHEIAMMRVVLDSGYDGPVGILDHRPDTDAEQSLRENLAGLPGIREALTTE